MLVQCGAPAPKLAGDLAGAQVVTVPLTSLFVFSTTHLSLLVDLGRLDVLTGVSRGSIWSTSPEVQTRIGIAKVTEFAKVGLAIDVERVVAAGRRSSWRPGRPVRASRSFGAPVCPSSPTPSGSSRLRSGAPSG